MRMSNSSDTRMTKLPWMKWYWGSYMQDQQVNSCSLAAQGLWVRMLGAMAQSERVGHLIIKGKRPSIAQIANMVSRQTEEVRPLLEELSEAGVFSRTSEGIIFSRRMAEEAAQSERCSINGKAGGGNPALKKQSEPPLTSPQLYPKNGLDEVPDIIREIEGGLIQLPKLEVRGKKEEGRKIKKVGRNPTDYSSTEGSSTLELAEPKTAVVHGFRSINQQCVDAWNEMAEATGLSKVNWPLNTARSKHLALRLKEIGGIDGWKHAVDQVRQCDTLNGKAMRADFTWVAGFDFLLQPSSMAKIMEGFYRNRVATSPKRDKFFNAAQTMDYEANGVPDWFEGGLSEAFSANGD